MGSFNDAENIVINVNVKEKGKQIVLFTIKVMAALKTSSEKFYLKERYTKLWFVALIYHSSSSHSSSSPSSHSSSSSNIMYFFHLTINRIGYPTLGGV